MSKIIALLFADPSADVSVWQDAIRQGLPAALFAAGALRVRLNLPDAAVAAGAALRQSPDGRYPNAVVQIWRETDSTDADADASLAAILTEAAAGWHGWRVEETVALANNAHPPVHSERTTGWAQIAVLVRPDHQPESEWLYAWQGRHTAVAIETQSTFEYVQNRVLQPWGMDGPTCAAIVEECFPAAALTDPLTFFDAPGDVAKFKANLAQMMASCERFITAGSIMVMPTSQYEFAH
jgi:hypothetical protein